MYLQQANQIIGQLGKQDQIFEHLSYPLQEDQIKKALSRREYTSTSCLARPTQSFSLRELYILLTQQCLALHASDTSVQDTMGSGMGSGRDMDVPTTLGVDAYNLDSVEAETKYDYMHQQQRQAYTQLVNLIKGREDKKEFYTSPFRPGDVITFSSFPLKPTQYPLKEHASMLMQYATYASKGMKISLGSKLKKLECDTTKAGARRKLAELVGGVLNGLTCDIPEYVFISKMNVLEALNRLQFTT